MKHLSQRVTPILLCLLIMTLLPTAFPSSPSVQAATTSGNFVLDWNAPLIRPTNKADWGDVDGDGDLDVVLGNNNSAQLYRNDGGALTLAVEWKITRVQAVAWGDYDGDGQLDLALGSDTDPSTIYHNDKGILTLAQQLPISATAALAWGDIDNDGDLDLAQGNSNPAEPSVIYRNTNGTFEQIQTLPAGSTFALAWADVDMDGDLDLAQGTAEGVTQILRNENGTLAPWQQLPNASSSLAWGDIDGDGDPDLALGAPGSGAIWLNNGGQLTLAETLPSTTISALAWGDADNDGDLDLAIGVSGTTNPSRIYLNDGGFLNTTSSLTIGTADTRSVAWGDYDGDGDSDMLVGNYSAPTQIYRNDSPVLTTYQSLGSDITRGQAWGDYDNDGDLDLAVANDTTTSKIYPFDQTTGQFTPPIDLPETMNSRAVAWGDADNDGDLDLAVAGYDQPSRLYRNDNGVFTLSDTWQPPIRKSSSVAWGDYDGDGRLDLAVGNGNAPNLSIYHNDGITFTTTFTSSVITGTTAIAWGDYDSDGDLDVAVAANGYPSQLYRNDNGHFVRSNAWQPLSTPAQALAWGDVDNDGNLDLVVGNSGSPSQLYRNQQGTLVWDTTWSPPIATTYSVAWGDMDNDGDLDLALGNRQNPSQVYRNEGGQLVLDAWAPPNDPVTLAPVETFSVAWGDSDNDGDLDLAQGTGTGSRIYRNTNIGSATALNQLPTLTLGRPEGSANAAFFAVASIITTTNVALPYTLSDAEGDSVAAVAAFYSLNGGGKWQPATAVTDTATTNLSTQLSPVYAAGMTQPLVITGNTTVTSTFFLPGDRPIEDLNLSLNLTHTNMVSLTITLIAPDGTHVVVLDGQGQAGPGLLDAVFDDAATHPMTGTPPYTGAFQPLAPLAAFDTHATKGQWKLQLSAPPSSGDGLLYAWGLGLTAGTGAHIFTWDTFGSGVFGRNDNVLVRLVAYPKQATAPFQRPSVATSSFPFRLRGTQVHVLDTNSEPVANAMVYRLSATQQRGGTLLSDSAANAFTSDNLGYLQGRGQFAVGDRLAALVPISATKAYTIYNTSPISLASGLPTFTVAAPGEQTLTISATRPLLLLNLSVSLEWSIGADNQYRDQLIADIGRTSELLYDWSDGQVALGKVTIYQEREHWNDANVQVYANSRLRPNAEQGGITEGARNDPVALGQIYSSGQIRMSAAWNRFGGNSNIAGEDWPRTLAHELGHYALFLDDNYIGRDATGNLIAVTSCPSAMSDPYRDDYGEFHPQADWSTACQTTLSNRATGRSDWQTITTFYPLLQAPTTFDALPGPGAQTLNMTSVVLQPAPTGNALLDITNLALLHTDGTSYNASSSARAFLYRADTAVDLGRPNRNIILARGAREGDELCVYDLGAGFVGCRILQAGSPLLTMNSVSNWQPDVIIEPKTATQLVITIPITGTDLTISQTLTATIYPLDGQPTVNSTLSYGQGAFRGTATFTAEMRSAQVRIQADATHQAITDYQVRGSLPQSNAAIAPSSCNAPFPQDCPPAPAVVPDGQVILYTDAVFTSGRYFSFQTVTALPPPPAWSVPVGQGYRFITSFSASEMITSNTALNLSYLESELPAGTEGGLGLYYWNGTTWERMPITRFDPDRNELTALINNPGIYTLMTSLPLQTGWNLFSYPWAETLPVTEALRLVNGLGHYTTIYGYQGNDQWLVYDIAPPTWANDLTGLSYGKGYWINVIGAQMMVTTVVTDPLNTIPQRPSTFYTTLVASESFTPTAGMTVTAKIGAAVCGQTLTRAVDGNVVFSIHVLAASSTRPTCGSPGAQISFDVGGYQLPTTVRWNNGRPSPLTNTDFSIFIPVLMR